VPKKTSTAKSNGSARNGGAKNGGSRKTDKPAPFRVARSSAGLGLFATQLILKGKFILEYWGRLITDAEAEKLNTKYLFDLNSRWTIDGSDRRNIARYINHSCKPNASAHEVRGKIRIYAKRNIQAGEEVAYNYGRDYFRKFLAPVGCRCLACKSPAKGSKVNGSKPNGASSKAAKSSKAKSKRGRSASAAKAPVTPNSRASRQQPRRGA
jgi:SET domain-containing protein